MSAFALLIPPGSLTGIPLQAYRTFRYLVWALSLSTMDLSTHSLSVEELRLAFGVLLGLVRISSP